MITREDRVLKEKEVLSKNIDAYLKFIESDVFALMHKYDQRIIKYQLIVMQEYEAILDSRIEGFL